MAKGKKESKISTTKKKLDKLDTTFRDEFTQFLIIAFSFVSAYAWRDAVDTAFNYYFPKAAESIVPRFIYAGAITIVLVAVVVAVLLSLGYGRRSRK